MDIIQKAKYILAATGAYLKGAEVITCGYNKVGGASQVIEMPDGKHVYMDMLTLCKLISRLVDRLEEMEKDNQRLKNCIRNAKEVYISMDGFIPETAPESYCLRLLEQMYIVLSVVR